ncbi:MAG: hypothetical protein MJD61_01035 [Proteobacteria bacterium]|nr:hypothetical protein [Pseudomonadota bacterium]
MNVDPGHGGQDGSWVPDAQDALDRGGNGQFEVLAARRPPLLGRGSLQALTAPLLAAIAWAGAVFRETVVQTPLDPWSLLMRMLALALTVRAVLLGIGFARTLRDWLSARRWAIVLGPEGLLVRSPHGDEVVGRELILAIKRQGSSRRHDGGDRFGHVYVICDGARRTAAGPTPSYLNIPPFFEASSGVLAETLMRWLAPIGPRPPAAASIQNRVPEVPGQTAASSSRLYDRVAAGEWPRGVAAIPHGPAWLKRGPYLSLLLGVALIEGTLRLPPSSLARLGLLHPVVIAACLLLVCLGWIGLTKRALRPRKGIAFIVTPSAVLTRTVSGVVEVPWRTVQALRIDVRRSWSLVQGYHEVRRLVLVRKDASNISHDEAFLAVPAEVALALCQAYKAGRAPVRPG